MSDEEEPIAITLDTKAMFTAIDVMSKMSKVDRFQFIVSADMVIIQSMREHTDTIAYRSTVSAVISKSLSLIGESDTFPTTDDPLNPFGFEYGEHQVSMYLPELYATVRQNKKDDLTIRVRDGTICISTSNILVKNEFFSRSKQVPVNMVYDGTFVANVTRIICSVLGLIVADKAKKIKREDADEETYISIGLVPDFPLQIAHDTPYLQLRLYAANKIVK
jgi:hypothetical protein